MCFLSNCLYSAVSSSRMALSNNYLLLLSLLIFRFPVFWHLLQSLYHVAIFWFSCFCHCFRMYYFLFLILLVSPRFSFQYSDLNDKWPQILSFSRFALVRLPPCFLSLAGAARKTCLPWQNFCRDKKQKKSVLSRQKKACRDKIMFVTASILLSRQNVFVATNMSCEQYNMIMYYFWRFKYIVL